MSSVTVKLTVVNLVRFFLSNESIFIDGKCSGIIPRLDGDNVRCDQLNQWMENYCDSHSSQNLQFFNASFLFREDSKINQSLYRRSEGFSHDMVHLSAKGSETINAAIEELTQKMIANLGPIADHLMVI